MAATFSELWILKPKVFIGNLGTNANEDELKELFSDFGPVKDLALAKEGNGFAFVEFEQDKDGLRATHGLKNAPIEERPPAGRSKHGPPRRGGGPIHRGYSSSSRPTRPRYPSGSRDSPQISDTISAFEAVKRMEERYQARPPSHRDRGSHRSRDFREHGPDQVSNQRERKPASPIPSSTCSRRLDEPPIYERRRSHRSEDRRYGRDDYRPDPSPRVSYRNLSPPPVKRRYVDDIPPEREFEYWERHSERSSSRSSLHGGRRESSKYDVEPYRGRKPASPSPYRDLW